ncbi:MAG: ABC transporter ATP-binding protein [Geminicoccaceae bacterium]
MTLRLEQVTKIVHGETHLADVDLELRPGRLHVLLGPTLAGKTTLMRIMAGLEQPTKGRVLEDGADVARVAVQKRSVAMVYQQFINYPTLTVYENIASPLRLRKLPADDIDARVRGTAKMLRIERLLDRLPAELSGGQQQRCAIARALAKEANLLLLDEPLANLDYKLREELRAELRDLFAKRPTIVVYATTEPTEALIMGGEVVLMDEGRVLQSGPTVEVYHRPGSLRAARTFSDPPINTLAVRIADGKARVGQGVDIPLPAHLQTLPAGEYTLGVRAAHLSMGRHASTDVPLAATVDLAEISGSETFVHVREGGHGLVVQEEGVHEYSMGDAVTVWIDPLRLYAFDAEGRLRAAPTPPTAKAA